MSAAGEHFPFVQSVLFKSPYSGCPQFSGWEKVPCGTIPSPYWPAQRNAPGAIMCVDRVKRGNNGPQCPPLQQNGLRWPYPAGR